MSQQFPSAQDLLMGSGATSVSWKDVPVGTLVTGTILSEPTVSQQTDMVKKTLKTYDNGDPMLQIVVTLQTDLRDPTKPDDTGRRALYVKNRMRTAVAEAVVRSGAPGLEVGGTLTVRFIGEEAPATQGLSPTKNYDAAYVPPASASTSALGLAPLQAAGTTTSVAAQQSFPAATPTQAASALDAAKQAAASAGQQPTGVDPAMAQILNNPDLMAALAKMQGLPTP